MYDIAQQIARHSSSVLVGCLRPTSTSIGLDEDYKEDTGDDVYLVVVVVVMTVSAFGAVTPFRTMNLR